MSTVLLISFTVVILAGIFTTISTSFIPTKSKTTPSPTRQYDYTHARRKLQADITFELYDDEDIGRHDGRTMYRSDKFKYSVLFPDTWHHKRRDTRKNLSPRFESSDILYDDLGFLQQGAFAFVAVEENTEKQLEELWQEMAAYRPPDGSDAPELITIGRTTLAGRPAIRQILDRGSLVVMYTIVESGKKFIVGCEYMPLDKRGLGTCEAIVASFQILQK